MSEDVETEPVEETGGEGDQEESGAGESGEQEDGEASVNLAAKKSTEIPELTMETRASMMGWVPKGRFRGDAKAWVDADKFVQRAEASTAILKERLSKSQAAQVKLQKAVIDVTRHQNEQLEKEKARHKIEIETLKRERKSAISEGDADKAEELDEMIDTLKSSPPAEPLPLPEEESFSSHVVDEWVAMNPWFNSDSRMRMSAQAFETVVFRENPNIPLEEALSLVEEEIRRVYPDKFENKRKKAPQTVEGQSRTEVPTRTTQERKKGWRDLPEEVMEIANKMIDEGLFKSRDEYAAKYLESA